MRALRILKPVLPLGIAYFIGRAIYENWRHVQNASWNFEWFYLLASSLLVAIFYALPPLVWKLILQYFGHDISVGAAYRTVRQAELSRYVPGGIWQYVSRVRLANRWGVPAMATMAAALVETVLLVLAAVVPALFSFREVIPSLAQFQIVLLILFLLGAMGVLQPRLLNICVGFLSKKLNQPYSELKIKWPVIAGIWIAYVLMWCGGCLGIGFFVRGVIAIPAEQVLAVGSFFATSWVIAMISIVAPAGMGIREGIFGLLLSQLLPLGTALTVAVGTRIWMTLLELFWTGLGIWFFSVSQNLTREKTESNRA